MGRRMEMPILAHQLSTLVVFVAINLKDHLFENAKTMERGAVSNQCVNVSDLVESSVCL